MKEHWRSRGNSGAADSSATPTDTIASLTNAFRITTAAYQSTRTHVYRAVRLSDERPVIIKLPGMGQNARRDNYLHEKAMLEKLKSSSHVPRLLEAREHDGQLVLILEECGGVVLDTLLARPMEIERFLRLALAIAEALGDVHACGVVHKDIKPANIMVNETQSTAHLIDFAIAIDLPVERVQLVRSQFVKGTLAYMSPEQTGRMNRGLDYRTDLYSLGVTLYRMLTGRLPFQCYDALTWCHAHLARRPEAPSTTRPTVPDVISDIVLTLMAKDAGERYQSATGLIRDLERCLQQWTSTASVGRFALKTRDRPTRFRVSDKLYGRERERATLLKTHTLVLEDGVSRAISISGSSGIGKSFLVHELHKPLTAVRGEFLHGKCDQYRRSQPYHAIAQVFREFVDTTAADMASWRQRISDVVGANGRVLTEVIPDLERLIGEQEPIPELGPIESQNRFNLVFRRFLRTIADDDRPLVIFLDDMQWSDNATIHLLETVLEDSQIGHILFILAYRDKEVPPTHSLAQALDRLRQRGALAGEIHLSALDSTNLYTLLADTMGTDNEDLNTRRVAELVHQKTAGNPFYTTQFLNSLYREGALAQELDSGRISYDLTAIECSAYTENVIDYMIRNLERFAPQTRDILKIAACCGNEFGLEDICLASELTPEVARAALMPAVRDELVVPMGESYHGFADDSAGSLPWSSYRFQHDRIQQASYAMLEDGERRRLHLRIGRTWRDHTSEPLTDERVFDIVGHLNQSIELITDPDERRQLARLDLQAARRAKFATAYDTALALVRAAESLLPESPWTEDYPLTCAIRRELAEGEYLTGNLDRAEQQFIELTEHLRSVSEAIELYVLRIRLTQVDGRFKKGLDLTAEALGLLGIEVPANPEAMGAEVGQRSMEILGLLDAHGLRRYADAPLTDDPRVIAIVDLVIVAGPNAYMVDVVYFAWYVNLGFSQVLHHGNTPSSSLMFSEYGVLATSALNRHRLAYQLSLLAIELNERLGNKTLRGPVLVIHANLLASRGTPVANNIATLERAYTASLEVGNLEYVGYICWQMPWWFYARGDRLSEVRAQSEKYLELAQNVRNQPAARTNELSFQYFAALRGQTASLTTLDDEHFDAAAYRSDMVEVGYSPGPAFLHTIEQMLHYLAGEYEESLAAADRAREVIDAVAAMYMEMNHHLFEGLAAAAWHDRAPVDQCSGLVQVVRGATERMGALADSCAENFLGCHLLLRGELARIEGRSIDAMRDYQDALKQVDEQGFIYLHALTHWIAGRHYQSLGLDTAAVSHLSAAHTGYDKWGAQAMVWHLEQLYPILRARRDEHERMVTSNSTSGVDLDHDTIIKATRAISREIDLDRLKARLLAIATESAGAEHTYLVLNIDGQVHAIDKHAHMRALADVTNIARSVVQQVLRSGETVLSSNAVVDPVYRDDPHIVARGVRSLLCLPIELKGRVGGALYLENRLLAGTFTAERVSLLEMVATQAAISLENATLYREMEKNLLALQIKSEQALESARLKDEFITNISHELRTPMNGILGMLELLVQKPLSAEQTHYGQLAIQSADALLVQLNRILDFANLQQGTFKLEETATEIRPLMQDLVESLHASAQAKGLSLLVDIAEEVPEWVSCDHRHLRLIMLELVDNAVKFSEEGQVRVSLIRSGSSPDGAQILRFSVTDSGCGISERDLELVFRPFTQADGTLTRAHGGMGLGLSLAERLVRAMGSTLKLHRAEGRGTVFSFELSLQAMLSPARERPQAPAQEGSTSGSEKAREALSAPILVVEDNIINLKVITKMLQSVGHEVVVAHDGRQAVERVSNQQFSLVFMDCQMPNMDGYGATMAIRQREANDDVVHQLPIVACTAHAREGERERALSAGMNDFLAKPVRREQLVAMISKWSQRA